MQFELKQNSKRANLDSAQYTLTFNSAENKANYKVLSALIQENDMIIEINSSRFLNPNMSKEAYFKEILEYIRLSDLDYTYSKVADNNNTSIFSSIFKKDKTAHQAICYLPNNIWELKDFAAIIPISGARYYILNGNDNNDILKDINKMMDDEILDYFQLIVFDPGFEKFQQMGINSKKLSKSQIEELLSNI